MEQQNKYYTPTIEELYVGWEGEACFSSYAGYAIVDFSTSEKSFELHEPEDKEAAKHWSKFWLIEEESLFTANNTRNYETAVMLLKDNRLRGKYLDQEDIESLGWKWSGTIYGEKMASKTSIYTLSTGTEKKDTKENRWQIRYSYDNQKASITQGINWMRFFGECKSKNELRKIMQWVGIM
jgi:hypothetical protein